MSETLALGALAHPGRLAVFRLLARRAPGGVRPQEIAEALGLRASTLSAHLGTLAEAGLVRQARDPADGRIVTYRIDLDRVRGVLGFLVGDCCRGRPELCLPPDPAPADPAAARPVNVLFLCTGNSARSILAEAILATEGAGRFRAFSAGARPFPAPDPDALALLARHGHDVSGLRPKPVAAFLGPDAPSMDFVFTVCDRAANEDGPPWPGRPLTAHWGVPDPVAAEPGAPRARAMAAVYRTMRRRLRGFLALPLPAPDRLALQHRLDALGHIDDPDPAAA